MSGFLVDRTMVVTRAKEQSKSLCDFLRSEGANVVELPVIEIQDPADGGAALESAVQKIENYEWVVVTSSNAADRLAKALNGTIPSVSFAVVGPQTAQPLINAGCSIELAPSKAVGDSLLSEFPSPAQEGNEILFVRAEKVRPLLADGLRDLGWVVEEVVAYRNVQPVIDQNKVTQALMSDAVIFTSASAVNRYTQLVQAPTPAVALCIGPVTAQAARENGYKNIYQAEEYSLEGLMSVTLEWAAK